MEARDSINLMPTEKYKNVYNVASTDTKTTRKKRPPKTFSMKTENVGTSLPAAPPRLRPPDPTVHKTKLSQPQPPKSIKIFTIKVNSVPVFPSILNSLQIQAVKMFKGLRSTIFTNELDGLSPIGRILPRFWS